MAKINDLFDLEYGHSLELNRLHKSQGVDAINFVGRAASNNGVTARVSKQPGIEPAPAGSLTVALNGQGGAGVAFVQPAPYYTAFHVMVLKPKISMTEKEKLWWAMCITANRFRFGFGRQANRTLKNLELPNPDARPEWVKDVDFAGPFADALHELKKLSAVAPTHLKDHVGTPACKVSDLFEVSYGNSLELNRMDTDPNGTNFIARTARNNGISAKVKLREGMTAIEGHCLTVAVSGSVLETFVQMEPFVTGFHVMVLRPKAHMNPEELMFYATCIRTNQWRYSYGRQANRTLKDLKIPARDSVPSFVYGSFCRVSDQLAAAL